MFVLIRLVPRTTLLLVEILPSKALMAGKVVMFLSRNLPQSASSCHAPGAELTSYLSMSANAICTAVHATATPARGNGSALAT